MRKVCNQSKLVCTVVRNPRTVKTRQKKFSIKFNNNSSFICSIDLVIINLRFQPVYKSKFLKYYYQHLILLKMNFYFPVVAVSQSITTPTYRYEVVEPILLIISTIFSCIKFHVIKTQ